MDLHFDVYINPIMQEVGFSQVQIYLPNETINALTDLITQKIDERTGNQASSIPIDKIKEYLDSQDDSKVIESLDYLYRLFDKHQ